MERKLKSGYWLMVIIRLIESISKIRLVKFKEIIEICSGYSLVMVYTNLMEELLIVNCHFFNYRFSTT